LFDAGSIKGGLIFDLSEYASGILQAQAISAVVPQFVMEFVEAPMLALIETAKRAAEFVKSAVESIAGSFHEVGLAAEKAGVSVEFLSRLEAAAKPAGVGLDALVNGFKTLEQRAELAAEGNEGAIKGFARLGISVAQAKTLMEEPEKFFGLIQERLGAMEDPALRSAAAMGVLGRGGFNLIPLLSQSAAETKKYTDTIKELGGMTDKTETEMGKKFGQLEGIFGAAWTGIKKAIAEPILKYFSEHFDEIVEDVKYYAQVIREDVGKAYEYLGPRIEAAWHFFKGLGEVISSVVMPAFKFLAPLLQLTFDLLAKIMDIIGPILSGIASIVHSVTGGVGPVGAASESDILTVKIPAPNINVDVKVNVPHGQLSAEAMLKMVNDETNKKIKPALQHVKDHMNRDRTLRGGN
jgi:hypothetical protein